MPSNRTVATPIVNKNGVSTTVHKRVDNSSSAKGRSIPAPSKSKAQAAVAERLEVVKEQIAKDPGGLGYILMNEVERERHKLSDRLRDKTLATLHPETLERLVPYKGTVLNPITNAMSTSVAERNFCLLNNMGVLFDVCDEDYYSSFNYYVAGLNPHQKVSNYRDYSDATESELKPVRAVLYASMHLTRNYVASSSFGRTPYHAIKSDRLVKLIEDRHEDAQDIVRLLVERRLPADTDEDIAVIEHMLDDGAQALREGAL